MSQHPSRRRHTTLILILLGLIALLIGVWIQQRIIKPAPKPISKPIALENGTMLSDRIPLSHFKLTDDNGGPFTNRDFKGHWNLVFFGFTHCPMICPTTLTELNKTYQLLKKSGYKPLPQVIFISVDPDRDSPQVIKKYLTHFNKRFVGATGTAAELPALTLQLGALSMKAMKSGEEDRYDVQHSGAIWVIDPSGAWVAVLSSPHTAKQIATNYKRIVKANKS